VGQIDSTIVLRRPSLAVESYGLSDRGKVRKRNEDQFLIAELAKAMRVRQSTLAQPVTQFGGERGYIFLVADGMGGAAGGEEASALAVGAIEDFALNTLRGVFHLDGGESPGVLVEFQDALRLVDARIFREAEQHPELRGMGTTVTLGYVMDGALFLVHVGDSRGYLLRESALYRLTEDHSFVGQMVRDGQLDAEQARHHTFRHLITNVVGGNERGVRVDVQKVDLAPDDLLLLCSNGLTEVLTDERIAEVMCDGDPESICRKLVRGANAGRAPDNVTVVVARFGFADQGRVATPVVENRDARARPRSSARA
jgi:serine/threonine protein phosphatase PrpC